VSYNALEIEDADADVFGVIIAFALVLIGEIAVSIIADVIAVVLIMSFI
jgi:hypothetical protein